MSFIFSNYLEDEPTEILENGDKVWLNKNGEYHREDGPAVISSCGNEVWYKNNKIHRENGPAATWPNGTVWWYLNDKLHREGGPAIIYSSGLSDEYWEHGKRIK